MEENPELGVWVDDSVVVVGTSEYWQTMRSLGFTSAALMIESVSGTFDPGLMGTERHAKRIAKLARDAGVAITLTAWPEPSRAYIDELRRLMPPLFEVYGPRAFESDLEQQWRAANLEGGAKEKPANGFATFDDAAEALRQVLEEFRTRFNVRIETTTYPFHAELSSDARISKMADSVFGQGYSVRNRTGKGGEKILVSWEDPLLGPGRMQRKTFERSSALVSNGRPEVCIGLAAYDQRWPNHTTNEAMTVAYEVSKQYRPREIRWWSSKWIFGALAARNPDVRRFFERLAKR